MGFCLFVCTHILSFNQLIKVKEEKNEFIGEVAINHYEIGE